MSGIEQVKTILKNVQAELAQATKVLETPTPTDPQTPTTPQPTGSDTIVVNAKNYKTILTNINTVDFAGTNTEYVQVNRDHNMLAIPCTYENLSVELDCMVVSSTESRLLQLQARGGRHSDGAMCEGCAYKASFENTKATHRKEIFHRSSNLLGGNGYCIDKAESQQAFAALKGRRVKLKFVVKNEPTTNNVLLSAFVNGVQVVNYTDKGSWMWDGSNQPVCPAREFGNTGNRKPNEKLNKAGVWVILRSDGDTIWRFWEAKVTKL